MKVGDLVRVKRGSFVTPGWFTVQPGEDGQFSVSIDEETLMIDSDVLVHEHRSVPITVTVELPEETSWSFFGNTASITPDPGGSMIQMGPVSGAIDWVDTERAALTLLAILQRKPASDA